MSKKKFIDKLITKMEEIETEQNDIMHTLQINKNVINNNLKKMKKNQLNDLNKEISFSNNGSNIATTQNIQLVEKKQIEQDKILDTMLNSQKQLLSKFDELRMGLNNIDKTSSSYDDPHLFKRQISHEIQHHEKDIKQLNLEHQLKIQNKDIEYTEKTQRLQEIFKEKELQYKNEIQELKFTHQQELKEQELIYSQIKNNIMNIQGDYGNHTGLNNKNIITMSNKLDQMISSKEEQIKTLLKKHNF